MNIYAQSSDDIIVSSVRVQDHSFLWKPCFFLIQILIRIWERQMRSPNLPLNKSKSNWATVPETRAVTSDQTVQTTVKRTQRPSWPLSAHLQQKHKPQPCMFFFFALICLWLVQKLLPADHNLFWPEFLTV